MRRAFPSLVSSPHIVTVARGSCWGGNQEEDGSISLWTQQLGSSCSEAGAGAQPRTDLLPQTRDSMETHERPSWEISKIQAFRDDATPTSGFCSGSAVQFRRLPFSVIQGHVQNHIYSDHPILPWMSESQLRHLDLNVFPVSVHI